MLRIIEIEAPILEKVLLFEFERIKYVYFYLSLTTDPPTIDKRLKDLMVINLALHTQPFYSLTRVKI